MGDGQSGETAVVEYASFKFARELVLFTLCVRRVTGGTRRQSHQRCRRQTTSFC